MKNEALRIAIICGGPSRERGISLNSARSLMDHLGSAVVEIVPILVTPELTFQRLEPKQLYSNTPADFDFRLDSQAAVKGEALASLLEDVDLVFPVVHGAFGEDGQLQALLDKLGKPYVASGAQACQLMFAKHLAQTKLEREGFRTLPCYQYVAGEDATVAQGRLARFWQFNVAPQRLGRAVVKPSAGGSSIGVFAVENAQDAWEKVQQIIADGLDHTVLVEPFCDGQEFTVLVVQDLAGAPVALVPSGIEMSYEEGEIFDFRRKYLPSTLVNYHCPPAGMSPALIATIRQGAEDVFKVFGARDFLRIDGWLLKDGGLLFSDINPISGMEQNSFIFQQAAWLGLTQRQILGYIAAQAAQRAGLAWPVAPRVAGPRQAVNVLMGGQTAERQVSLMSGTNVWLKLINSSVYQPKPYFLDVDLKVWPMPLPVCLLHTTEEVISALRDYPARHAVLAPYQKEILGRLGLPLSAEKVPTEAMSLPAFLEHSQAEGAFVFLGLHGGMGENGELQTLLANAGLPFNGPLAAAARLCADKAITGAAVSALNDPMITTVPKKSVDLQPWFSFSAPQLAGLWQELTTELGDIILIKPQSDGCSAGVVALDNPLELGRFLHAVATREAYIPAGTFKRQAGVIDMPANGSARYLLERFIVTDRIVVEHQQLGHQQISGLVEMTIGVLEDEQGHMHALNPSITVAAGSTLTVEEKFQGGTGINLTPPPENLLAPAALQQVKTAVEKVAAALGLSSYARLDLFVRLADGFIYVIEVNTLPALTPSTVLFHQGLAEPVAVYPAALLEGIIRRAQKRVTPQLAA